MEIGFIKGFGLFVGKDGLGWVFIVGPVMVETRSKHGKMLSRIGRYT